MKRGMIMVRGTKADGKEGMIDFLDLDETSFRAFLFEVLHKERVVGFGKRNDGEGPDIRYRERQPRRKAVTESTQDADGKTAAELAGKTPE